MIASHSPDAEILEGYAETFRATVSDDDNEFEELSVVWYVGEAIVCDWEAVNPAENPIAMWSLMRQTTILLRRFETLVEQAVVLRQLLLSFQRKRLK